MMVETMKASGPEAEVGEESAEEEGDAWNVEPVEGVLGWP